MGITARSAPVRLTVSTSTAWKRGYRGWFVFILKKKTS